LNKSISRFIRGALTLDSVRNQWICAFLALVICFLVWSPGVSGPYQFDDYATPLTDPASQSLSSWGQQVKTTLRPVTKLTYALESEGGFAADPGKRRIVSIVFHFIAGLLLFLLLRKMEPRLQFGGALLIAGIWLFHPVHADSILLLAGRTAVLSSLFLLASMLLLELRRPILAALLFLAAALSRETAIAGVFPLIVVAMSKPATRKEHVHQILPLMFAAMVAILWCLFIPRYQQLAEFSFLGRPFEKSAIHQIGAVPVGLWLIFKPSALSLDYGIPLPSKISAPLFLLGLFCYVAAVLGVLLTIRRQRMIAIGLSIWLAALLPTQSVIPKLDAVANRPLSLALAGLLVALVPGIVIIFSHKRIKSASAVAFAIILFGLGISTIHRSALFQSEIALWSDAASKSIVNARPHLQYAMLLHNAGRHQHAFVELSIARAIDPFNSRIDALWDRYKDLKEETQ
jgi:protein O-mannosyl-transferase